MVETEIKKETALLAAVDSGEYSVDVSLAELCELANAADVEVLGTMVQNREKPDAGTFMGTGKLGEIKEFCENNEVDVLIFDHELSATQIRNIEKITGIRTIDRTMLILDIFSQRAKSSEGRLQVELARQKYMLPRLAGMGITMSRIGGGGKGGVGARRGAGETKLETDRRKIRDRIHFLSGKLKEMESRREEQRKKRKKQDIPIVVIVGYTNVGKSTLLNRLSQSDIFAEDMLFATLDPTARAVELPDGRSIVMIDTVGFVRRLPHHLVEAFKSTLEEATDADVILNVCDASGDEAEEQAEVTTDLLKDLGAEKTPMIMVLNKCDVAKEVPDIGKNTVKISAKTGEGIDLLLTAISKAIPESTKRMNLLFPYIEAGIIDKIRENGIIVSQEYENEGIIIDAHVDKKLWKLVEPFCV